jgi:hypothetical protein
VRGVRPRELGGLDRDVRCEHARVRSFVLQGESDRSRPRPDVDDDGIFGLPEALERRLDEDLGLRAGNEHARTHVERYSTERLLSGEMLQRNTGATLADRTAEHPGLARVEPLRSGVHRRAVGVQDDGHQDFGGLARACDVVTR